MVFIAVLLSRFHDKNIDDCVFCKDAKKTENMATYAKIFVRMRALLKVAINIQEIA